MRFLEKFLITLVIGLSAVLAFLIFVPDSQSLLMNHWAELQKKTESWENALADRNESNEKGGTVSVGESGDGYTFSAAQYIYYGMLGEEEQKVYARFYANALNKNAVFNVSENVNPDMLQNIFQAMYYDHPELFWLDNTYSYQYDENTGNVLSVTLEFNETINQIDEAQSTFETAADEILVKAEQYQSDYEKEKYVHDTLIAMTDYDLNADMNQSAYSLLVNHRTVCAGYARAFQYLMNRLGIVTYYAVGTSEGQDHAWNLVMLDGEFYNVDVTWDDAASDADPYYFFDLADDEFNLYHSRGGLSVSLPACTSTAYSHREDAFFYQYYHFVPAE